MVVSVEMGFQMDLAAYLASLWVNQFSLKACLASLRVDLDSSKAYLAVSLRAGRGSLKAYWAVGSMADLAAVIKMVYSRIV